MMLAGMYLLPLVNVTPLVLANNIFSLVVITVMTALAALGYGVLVGTIAGTHVRDASTHPRPRSMGEKRSEREASSAVGRRSEGIP